MTTVSSIPSISAPAADHFQNLYARSADPWQLSDSWYEQRKLAILLACLPKPRFTSIYEPGCGNGTLTLALAARCDHLLASDFCDEAVRLTTQRLRQATHVKLARQSIPEQWPRDSEHPRFDLVVMSELCYYLDEEQLRLTAALSVGSLQLGGYLLACHWKQPFDDRHQETAVIHEMFCARDDLVGCARYEDDEFRLDLWQKNDAGDTQ